MIKAFLTVCSYAFGSILFFYLISAIGCIFHRKEYGWDTAKKVFRGISPIRLYRDALSDCDVQLWRIVLVVSPVICILGFINAALYFQYSEPKIGSFFEKSEYVQDYEATLQTRASKIFCIATVNRSDGKYYIDKIQLPYGHIQTCWGDEYNEVTNCAKVWVGVSDIDLYDLSLGPMATETSYEYLKTYVVSSSGGYCGSKNSNKYRLKTCPQVKNINRGNLIYFKTIQDADTLGFYACSTCNPDE